MNSEEIAKIFRQRARKELKGKDLLWKLEYSMVLNWFGEYFLDKRYVSKEIAAGCKSYLKKKRAGERLLQKSQAFDAAFNTINDTMDLMLANRVPDPREIVKAVLEIDNDLTAEGAAYRILMSGSAAPI